MNFQTVPIMIYRGCWNGREYACAISFEQARQLVERHPAYGNPSLDDYAVGDEWAEQDSEFGWRIVESEITATSVSVEFKGIHGAETVHWLWVCPYCQCPYSDDCHPEDKLPLLLCCGCNERSRYLLGVPSGDVLLNQQTI